MNDYIGKRFGMLTIIAPYKDSKKKFVCKCDCGNYINLCISQLNMRRSCGCVQEEKAKKDSKTKLYTVWQNMKSRCKNPHNKAFKWYGGRGIKVCDEWGSSFKTFKKWALENGYVDGLTIERIDVNGNYEPSNCKWIPFKEQHDNTHKTIWIEVDGVRKTEKQWSRETGISYCLIIDRVNRGINPKIIVTAKSLKDYSDDELGIKRRTTSKPVLQFTLNGEFVARYESVKEAKEKMGKKNCGISQCCTGVYESSCGYKWKYEQEISNGIKEKT